VKVLITDIQIVIYLSISAAPLKDCIQESPFSYILDRAHSARTVSCSWHTDYSQY